MSEITKEKPNGRSVRNMRKSARKVLRGFGGGAYEKKIVGDDGSKLDYSFVAAHPFNVESAELDVPDKVFSTLEMAGSFPLNKMVQAEVARKRGGRRDGQYAYVGSEHTGRGIFGPAHSMTVFTVLDKEGNVLRERRHSSKDVGITPHVAGLAGRIIDQGAGQIMGKVHK